MLSFSRTDIGQKRKMNQDVVYEKNTAIGNLPNLFIVADGMGGHAAGDYASKYTVETIERDVEESKETEIFQILGEAIDDANTFLRQKAAMDTDLQGMGTTVVAAVVKDKELYVANVGDSRLYIVNKEEIRQITVDHSLVEEMIQNGGLDRISARTHPDKNIITRAIGAMDYVDIDFFSEEIQEGDVILMCSDGLSNMVEDEQIREIVCGEGTLSDRGNRLVDLANENGGRDNITVVLVDCYGSEVAS